MKRITVITTVLLLVLSLFAVAQAATVTPGSEGDPVVTKSYVDSEIAKIKGSSATSATFEAVFVNAGKSVLGGDGTEMILRSGEAKSISNIENGIADLTAGKDLMGSQSILPNHLLLVPRNDGRGISATTDIWIMIKGQYKIQ